MPEKAYAAVGGDAATAREHLKRHPLFIQPNHLRQRSLVAGGHFGKRVVGHVLGFDRDDVAADLNYPMIDFFHWLRSRSDYATPSGLKFVVVSSPG
jgi:hypothetical protein